MNPIYDKIGTGYNTTRQADSRIVDRIVELLALPLGSRVLDVGAGTGSYARALVERGYQVTALEPSLVMREQAEEDSPVLWVEGSAESLPFTDHTFDAAILILCIHHFTDIAGAFAEIRKVVRQGPVVIFTYDPAAIESPWLFQYFPVFREQIRGSFSSMERIRDCFENEDSVAVHPFPLPHDLSDGFAGTAWRYPERYLDQDYRDGTSAFRQLDPSLLEEGLAKLTTDLQSGQWDSRYGTLRSENQL